MNRQPHRGEGEAHGVHRGVVLDGVEARGDERLLVGPPGERLVAEDTNDA